MLLKFIGTSSQVDVETGYGERTVNPGDYIYATEEAGLHERYQDLFEVVEVGGEIKQKKTTITSAQVLALNTTPIAIVPAPGAGYFIDVDSISVAVDYGSAAYATNTTLEFRYTDGSGAKVTADVAAILDATADKVNTVKGVVTELVNVANAAVVATVATGDPVTGDSPITVNVVYRVMPSL